MCVSSVNEGKTQVGWIVVIKQQMWKWANANNTPPKRSSCHVNSNEMTIKSRSLKAFKKYNGNEHV
jgi:hypothetical protein